MKSVQLLINTNYSGKQKFELMSSRKQNERTFLPTSGNVCLTVACGGRETWICFSISNISMTSIRTTTCDASSAFCNNDLFRIVVGVAFV